MGDHHFANNNITEQTQTEGLGIRGHLGSLLFRSKGTKRAVKFLECDLTVVERTGLESLCSGTIMCSLPLHVTPAQGKYSRALQRSFFLASSLQVAKKTIEIELLGHKAGKLRKDLPALPPCPGTWTKENKGQSPTWPERLRSRLCLGRECWKCWLWTRGFVEATPSGCGSRKIPTAGQTLHSAFRHSSPTCPRKLPLNKNCLCDRGVDYHMDKMDQICSNF